MGSKFKIRVLLISIVSSGSVFLLNNVFNQSLTDRQVVDNILSILGSRNTSEFVKPLKNTVLINIPHLFPHFSSESADPRLEIPAEKIIGDDDLSGLEHKKDPIGAKGPRILIVVLSQIGYEKERQAIRETWYQWTDQNVRIVFFLGLPSTSTMTFELTDIVNESNKYKDIILDDIRENYYLLAVKVVRILKWFQQTFPVKNSLQGKNYRPNFLVKTDHDVFVNIPKLIADLTLKTDNPDFIGGLIHDNVPVYRNKNAKWFTPEQLWAKDIFPEYVAGLFYCMAGNVVSRIYEASLQEPFFHMEDIFITGFVANLKLGIQLQGLLPPQTLLSQIRIALFGWNPNSAIAFHSADTNGMKQLYRKLAPHKI